MARTNPPAHTLALTHILYIHISSAIFLNSCFLVLLKVPESQKNLSRPAYKINTRSKIKTSIYYFHAHVFAKTHYRTKQEH